MLRRASISPDGLYRYTLLRRWARGGDRILWIMLNPSRADAKVDDPTIRRCIGFSREWGFSAMEVVNLYALRSPTPDPLRAHANPVGPRNDAAISRALARASRVIAAWGAFGWAAERARVVIARAAEIQCLGTTQNGWPRHPLYVPSNASVQPWHRASARCSWSPTSTRRSMPRGGVRVQPAQSL